MSATETCTANAPAVMLCNSDSIFPRQLAAWWRRAGLETVLVTRTGTLHAGSGSIDGFRVVDVDESWGPPLYRQMDARLVRPILRRLEQRVLSKYVQRRHREPDLAVFRTPLLATSLMLALPLARAARSISPRFVFGHEVTSYGLATALAHGVPRIIFPWGGDIFGLDESTPMHKMIARYALRNVELIVPSSTTAARHLVSNYGVNPDNVVPISWGVDLETFRPAWGAERAERRRRLGINPDAVVISNVRRFWPQWGCFVALEAFLQLAEESPETHFVLAGGSRTDEGPMPEAVRMIEARGLSSRFLILHGEVPLETIAEIMSVSDVAVSLAGRFDMRSSSVLQAAASGGAPVIGRHEEYELMIRDGFAALLVDPADAHQVVDAIRHLVVDQTARARMAAANARFVAEHEDQHRQMKRLLSEIDRICEPRRQ